MAEEAGIATVCVSTGRDLTAQVKPPRAVFVNHPMGNNFGPPDDPEMQRRIMRDAFELLETETVGGTRKGTFLYDRNKCFELPNFHTF